MLLELLEQIACIDASVKARGFSEKEEKKDRAKKHDEGTRKQQEPPKKFEKSGHNRPGFVSYEKWKTLTDQERDKIRNERRLK